MHPQGAAVDEAQPQQRPDETRVAGRRRLVEDVVGSRVADEAAGVRHLDPIPILLHQDRAGDPMVPVAERVHQRFPERDLGIGAVLEVVGTSAHGLDGIVRADPFQQARQRQRDRLAAVGPIRILEFSLHPQVGPEMAGNMLTQGGLRPGEQQSRARQPAVPPDADRRQQLLVTEREQVGRNLLESGRRPKRLHCGRGDQLLRAARNRLRRAVAIAPPSLQFPPQTPGERLAVLAPPDQPATGRVRIRREAVVDEHDDDASGPFRHLDLFDDRRQLGIRAVVHRPLQPIQVHLGRHSAYGPSAAAPPPPFAMQIAHSTAVRKLRFPSPLHSSKARS